MAGDVSLRMVGDWSQQCRTLMKNALAVSVDVAGRTGEQACRHALILMAESARKLTKKAPARRKVLRDARLHGAQYVEVWQHGKSEPVRLHKFRFSERMRQQDRVPGTWENAQKIGNRGLAGRAWMWGLKKLGGSEERKPIPGASRVYSINGENLCGYIKENRLSYITAPGVMPAGWESAVEVAAGNKIMAQARAKLEREWKSAMGVRAGFDFGRMAEVNRKRLDVYFLKVAA